ncbi:MAG: hypothetical protein HYT30_01020 [Parcubacteria group bacterium]|nr:hypothetical protein [Parcubacteria group bacterium]
MEKLLEKSICFVVGTPRLSHRICNTPPSPLPPRRASGAFPAIFHSGGVFLILILFAPTLAFAAPQTWSELVALVVLIINVAIPMLVALALVLFLVRSLMVMTGHGGEGGEHGFAAARFRKVAIWGVGILFVMASIWGILTILQDTFLSSGGGGGNFGAGGSGEALPCNSLNGSGC